MRLNDVEHTRHVIYIGFRISRGSCCVDLLEEGMVAVLLLQTLTGSFGVLFSSWGLSRPTSI